MKSKFLIYLLVYFLVVSCTNNTGNSAIQAGKTRKASPISCYRYSTTNDTITLKLIHVGKSITGTLVYKLKGKDKIVGTILGGMRGDLLVADYTRMSEEILPVMQI